MKHLTTNEYIDLLLSAEDSPKFACGKCLNSVPSEMNDLAERGGLGPCPICGGTELVENPGNLQPYVKHSSHDGAPLGVIPDFVRFVPCYGLTPPKKGKKHRKSMIFQIQI